MNSDFSRQARALAEAGMAHRYGESLLRSLAVQARPLQLADEHPALGWARSGLMQLTGAATGHPQMCPAALTACADGALAALASLAPEGALLGLHGAALLGERAAIAGHLRQGTISPGGSCRLLPAADGWIAVNLARDEDWELLPAWLETDAATDWVALAAVIGRQRVADLVLRGRELGLALASMQPEKNRHASVSGSGGFYSCVAHRKPDSRWRRNAAHRKTPRVLDLSSLWAGPLCTHLLQRCGADVIKCESRTRPDGARRGPAAFNDLLNAGKRSVALDFSSAEGIRQLRRLIADSDIVVESTRPRALRQLGLDAEALVERQAGLTWVSVSGYGRGEPQENWIAYGDDAAVDAGLSQCLFDASGQRLIVGDAIADPLCGLHAALAAWRSWMGGGGEVIALSLSNVVAHCLRFEQPPARAGWRERQLDWEDTLQRSGVAPARPVARAASGRAAALGAHNAVLL